MLLSRIDIVKISSNRFNPTIVCKNHYHYQMIQETNTFFKQFFH